jgi:hypothetical protein
MSHLLVIDFDFFFPNPREAEDIDSPTYFYYDWAHAESPLLLSNLIWVTRASPFLAADLPLPGIVAPEGGWQTFWDRFTFTDDATMTFADSNVHAGEISPPTGDDAFESVLLFDAHHDSGYRIDHLNDFIRAGHYSCEDWLLYQQIKGCTDLTVRYPAWKPNGVDESVPTGCLTQQSVDDGSPIGTVFDTVFICRSGAWVPAWCDRDFIDIVDACPVGGSQRDHQPMDRRFPMEQAQAMAQAQRDQIAAFDADGCREQPLDVPAAFRGHRHDQHELPARHLHRVRRRRRRRQEHPDSSAGRTAAPR